MHHISTRYSFVSLLLVSLLVAVFAACGSFGALSAVSAQQSAAVAKSGISDAVIQKSANAINPTIVTALHAAESANHDQELPEIGAEGAQARLVDFVQDKDTHRTKVYADDKQKVIYVSYRNSRTAHDWWQNAKAFPADCKVNGGKTSLGRCHLGFLQEYKSQEDRMYQTLDPYVAKGYKVVVTGHSLGGAVATIAAGAIGAKYGDKAKIDLVTFGSPRVGNSAFNKKIQASVQHAERFVVESKGKDDPITAVVPKFLGYRDLGEERTLPCLGGCKSFQKHSLTNYVAATQELGGSVFRPLVVLEKPTQNAFEKYIRTAKRVKDVAASVVRRVASKLNIKLPRLPRLRLPRGVRNAIPRVKNWLRRNGGVLRRAAQRVKSSIARARAISSRLKRTAIGVLRRVASSRAAQRVKAVLRRVASSRAAHRVKAVLRSLAPKRLARAAIARARAAFGRAVRSRVGRAAVRLVRGAFNRARNAKARVVRAFRAIRSIRYREVTRRAVARVRAGIRRVAQSRIVRRIAQSRIVRGAVSRARAIASRVAQSRIVRSARAVVSRFKARASEIKSRASRIVSRLFSRRQSSGSSSSGGSIFRRVRSFFSRRR